MIIDSPIISGSQNASGPLTQIGNVQITGSLSVTGTINGSITGSVTSASYATTAEFLDGLDSTSFVFTSSFNTFSGSAAGRITNLEAFSSSLDATFATDASVTASILVLSGSVQASQAALSSSYTITSGSYASASGSLSIRTTNLEATSSTLVAASSSFAADSASLSTRLTGDETNITTLTNASGSFAAQSASLSTRITQDETNFTNLSSSFATTSGSLSTRVTNLESTSSTVSSSFASTSGSISGRVTLIEGQYATTGSNVFTGPQFINQASNAISFTSTASLYTPGGARITKDLFVSGTSYFNNVVVYGTSSIQYITSSQVNFGTNIITVNTDTPAVRFGGLAVFDSGSTQLTGSMLWDSERNHWIYSNPSGSAYNSAMLMNGPRNTGSLGSEQGTTSCALMIGQGGDHITSSMIYSYGNATCFYGQSFISASGDACFSGQVCAPTAKIGSNTTVNSGNITFAGYPTSVCFGNGQNLYDNGSGGLSISSPTSNIQFETSGSTKLNISLAGVATFCCQVCAPSFIGGTISGTNASLSGDFCYTSAGDVSFNSKDSNIKARFTGNNASAQIGLFRCGTSNGGVYIGGDSGNFNVYKDDFSCTLMQVSSTGNACFRSSVCAPIGCFTTSCATGLITTQCAIIGANSYNALYLRDTGWWVGLLSASEACWGSDSLVISVPNNRPFVVQNLATACRISGCVMLYADASINKIGINTCSPKEALHVAGAIATTGTATCAFASSSTMDWYAAGTRIISRGADTSTRGTFRVLSETSNSSVSCYTLFIDSSGVSCFACQICVGGMVALTNSTFGTPGTEGAFRIRMADNGGVNNDPGIGLDGSAGGGERMWFNTLGGFYFNLGTGGTKINIDSAGVACFCTTICTGGSILPTSNGAQNLGSSSYRWCTVYTSDLSLNNGIGNYTIVEGESDLFLYNNNSCKVFKFLLQEVCPEIAPAKRSI